MVRGAATASAWLSRAIRSNASASASSVWGLSVSVGSIMSASSTIRGKYTVGGWTPKSSIRLARSRVRIPSSRFIGPPERTNSCMQSLSWAAGFRVSRF